MVLTAAYLRSHCPQQNQVNRPEHQSRLDMMLTCSALMVHLIVPALDPHCLFIFTGRTDLARIPCPFVAVVGTIGSGGTLSPSDFASDCPKRPPPHLEASEDLMPPPSLPHRCLKDEFKCCEGALAMFVDYGLPEPCREQSPASSCSSFRVTPCCSAVSRKSASLRCPWRLWCGFSLARFGFSGSH